MKQTQTIKNNKKKIGFNIYYFAELNLWNDVRIIIMYG